MKNLYIVIDNEEREIVDVIEIKSDLNIEDFCKNLLKEKVDDLREKEVEEEYIKEWCGYGKFGSKWEVNYGEGLGYDVYEVK